MTETGVRSSCEASAVNWRCCAKASSSRAKVSFSTAASRPSSLPGSSVRMRSERLPAAIRPAVSLIASMGRITRDTRNHPPASPMPRTPPPTASSPNAKLRNAASSGAMDLPANTTSPGGVAEYASRTVPRVRVIVPASGRAPSGVGTSGGAVSERPDSCP